MSTLFGKVCQNGYVVRDIEKALKFWTEVLRIGPFFFVPKVRTDWFRYRGKYSPVEMSIALANSGDLQIELIQQRNDAPSMYLDFLDRYGEGLQHMSYWSTDYQSLYERAIGAGFVVGHEGQIGGPKGRFAYFETPGHAGTIIEISDVSGRKGRFFEHIRAEAASWDGSDPVRLVES
jgi:catechol 2,3-dioxygenase-like lactoylglutathione lyase family enzyme